MDNTTLALFMHELRNQCAYIETSFRIFNQAMEQQASTAVFFSAQSTLLAASQVGAVLWPRRARAKRRGESIRAVLQLADKHPLNDKRLTALWEHADEKLEDWIGKTKGEQIVFDHLGPITDFDQMQVAENCFYRLYDPTTMTFYYRGDGYKMQAIADAISDIYTRVNAVHKQMFPEQHEPAEAPTQTVTGASFAIADSETDTGGKTVPQEPGIVSSATAVEAPKKKLVKKSKAATTKKTNGKSNKKKPATKPASKAKPKTGKKAGKKK